MTEAKIVTKSLLKSIFISTCLVISLNLIPRFWAGFLFLSSNQTYLIFILFQFISVLTLAKLKILRFDGRLEILLFLRANLIHAVLLFILISLLFQAWNIGLLIITSDFYFKPMLINSRIKTDFMSLIGILLISPILEELIFRKFLFSYLFYKTSRFYFSVGCSSIAFALVHMPNIQVLLPSFLFGIILCRIMRMTRSISQCIILHIIYNITSLLISYWFDFSSIFILENYTSKLSVLILILFFIGIFIFVNSKLINYLNK